MVDARVETLALLFTDIEGSTNLLRRLGADYRELLTEHRRLLRVAFEAHGGEVFGSEGDALFVSFHDPVAAVRAAVDGQLALSENRWPADSEVRVRMGIHTGDVIVEGDDRIGLAVHQAARISSAAHGGQVLISDATSKVIEPDFPEGLSLHPLGRFRLKDFPDPQELYQLKHPSLPGDFPVPRTGGSYRHNLPRSITSFVGREREVTDLIDLLENTSLATLTGPGGSGKTRLAIQAATALLADRPDGVWFVDLARVSEPDLVIVATADSVGVQETHGRPLDEAVRDFLSNGRPLLILDNCEHLIGACAELTEQLLASCPGLTILTTAREPLGIAGEVIRRVPGLSVPTSGDADSSADAVQLFLERARAIDPEFEPTGVELGEIGQITRRLDGIPLAIEMAAALVGTLAVKEIASRLDDRFRLLTGGGGRSLGRQQTLLATVDWSYELLTQQERVLLRRLSLFSGSFSLDAVEGICWGDGIDSPQIVGLLRRLVATSWVTRQRSGGQVRFRLLETSRQYALEKLIAASEAMAFRSRHCDWFRDLAEIAAPKLLGAHDQSEWFDRIEVDLDNFRGALAWGLGEEGDAASGLRIATALSRFWEVRGHWSEGWRWIEEALESTPAAGDELRAPALAAAAFLAFYRGDLSKASALSNEGLDVARRIGDGRTEARTLRFAAVTSQRLGHQQAALALAEAAVELSRKDGEPADLAFALQVLGRLLVDERRDEAQAFYEEGLAVARAGEDDVSQIYLLYALGQIAVRDEDNDRAREIFSEALDLSERVGERWMAMNVLVELSSVTEDVDAGPAVEELVGLQRQIGNRMMLITWLRRLAHLRRLEGDVEGARRAVEEAMEVSARDGGTEAKVLAHYLMGSHFEEGEHDAAAALADFRDGLRLAYSHQLMRETAFGLSAIGLLLNQSGAHEKASTLLGAAEALRENVGMRPKPLRTEALKRAVQEIERKVGAAERVRLWDSGRDMPLDKAVAFAVQEDAV